MAMSACQQGGRTLFLIGEGENELKSVQCKSAANLMRKEFGERICDTCGECCNRQYKSKVDKVMICIAFDDETKWDRNEKACGLFNIPFSPLPVQRKGLTVHIAIIGAFDPVFFFAKPLQRICLLGHC